MELASNSVHIFENESRTKDNYTLENYFSKFRNNIIGIDQIFDSPFGEKEIIYADWTASGRVYGPIEEQILKKVMPFIGNTHTATTITGSLMTKAYEKSKLIIKQHVNANKDDILLFCGSGMTDAVNKLQRILGLRVPERIMDYTQKGCAPNQIDEEIRPIVFVTHMEHHSNHLSWLETISTVEIIHADERGLIDLEHFKYLLELYRHRKNKIAAVTACSNVTGIEGPFHEIAKMIHLYGGLCFVDFACSAPYVKINMHPEEEGAHLDAIYFSAHKFLGGPGTPGVLVFNNKIYKNTIPDQPGGGTVTYSNPWNFREYTSNIEQREDGGTPPFLQAIKAAMCVKLKESMGVENIAKREEELLQIVFTGLSKIKKVNILEERIRKRLAVVSFIVEGAHHSLIVKILNDRFGIQSRGGCSCAGTYGHYLLQVDETKSYEILNLIQKGKLFNKPGWIRISIHPTMTDSEICYIVDSIEQTANNFEDWMHDYIYDPDSNEFVFKGFAEEQHFGIERWFCLT